MDNDDAIVGRILKRRDILALFGAAGAGLIAAACGGDAKPSNATPASATPVTGAAGTTPATSGATGTGSATQAATATGTTAATASGAAAVVPTTLPQCVVTPALTEGPFFVDEKLNRADIRPEPSTGVPVEGVPLSLAFNVQSFGAAGCRPLANATVDVWQCDAAGVYSDVSDGATNARGKKFLRGYQVTDANGIATFTTIFPGWYQGRTVHIHFKVRGTAANGKAYEFTSQIFFEDSVADEVFKSAPYAAKGPRTTRNANDSIFRQSGNSLLVPIARTGSGYAGSFAIGLTSVA